MNIENKSARLITLVLAKKEYKIIPTHSVEITNEEFAEVKADKVMNSWLESEDLVANEVAAKKSDKAPLTDEVVENSDIVDLDATYNIKELKAYAKSKEIDGYSNMNKIELLEAIKPEVE